VHIRERLDYITSLLSQQQQQQQQQQRPPQPQQLQHAQNALAGRSPAVASPAIDRTSSVDRVVGHTSPSYFPDFPFMTIQTKSMMDVLGVDRDLAIRLLNLERADASRISPLGGGRVSMLPYNRALSALGAFSEKVHIWYPILHPSFSRQYLHIVGGSFPQSADSCLVLLIAAIGSLAEHGSITQALEHRPDAAYIEVALCFLPVVLAESNIRSIQCFVFLAIYHLCLLKPLQAYDYALIASFKTQNVLRSHIYDGDAEQLELVRRAYWAILLIESELAVQFDLAESGIWKADNDTPLPSGHETWHFAPTPSPAADPTSPNSGLSTGSTSDEMLSYFLAEIAMRRMLQRCKSAVSHTSHGQLVYAPIIATELQQQLDEWFGYLPEQLRFDRGAQLERTMSLHPLSLFLQLQYFACRASIFWPAVYQAMETGQAVEWLLPYCKDFFESYTWFMDSATRASKSCLPNLWTIHLRYVVTNVLMATLCCGGR